MWTRIGELKRIISFYAQRRSKGSSGGLSWKVATRMERCTEQMSDESDDSD
jgi:hypothetical protein